MARRRYQVERLEQRSLLSVTISEFPVPGTGTAPTDIVTGPDANLWFTQSDGNEIGRINPASHAIAEIPVPTAASEPLGITPGPDGNLWFTEFASDKIGQLDPSTLAIAEFAVPTALAAPREIVAGPDGNLWFTEEDGDRIGQINPTTHAILEFPIPTADSNPEGITAAPDGNLWFTEGTGNKIAEINPTTHAITEFAIPTASSLPFGIAAGPDGDLWFTEETGNNVGQFNLTTHAIHEFAAPTAGSELGHITSGFDGNLWFTERGVGQIGLINPATGAVTEVPTPTARSDPLGITAGPDGNLWFTELAGQIGQAIPAAPLPAPDVALSGDAPSSVTLGSSLSYTLTLTNDGTAGATGVTLIDTLPAGVNFVSATGTVMPENSILRFDVGNLGAGASVSFRITVKANVASALTNEATASLDQLDRTPADNSLVQITTVAPVAADGPTIVSVHRYGFHAQPTTLVITFDKQLDVLRAESTANYQIFSLAGPRHAIRIKSAVYDAATRTVTLSPVHRLNLHRRFRLTVIGTGPSGVSDSAGNLLDGLDDGDPGHDFVTMVTGKDLVLGSADLGNNSHYRKAVSSRGADVSNGNNPSRVARCPTNLVSQAHAWRSQGF
jgi:uncharacterized repeat protein (TIGR01451 family)